MVALDRIRSKRLQADGKRRQARGALIEKAIDDSAGLRHANLPPVNPRQRTSLKSNSRRSIIQETTMNSLPGRRSPKSTTSTSPVLVALIAGLMGFVLAHNVSADRRNPPGSDAAQASAVTICPWSGPGVIPFGGTNTDPGGSSLRVYDLNVTEGWAKTQCAASSPVCTSVNDPGCSAILADGLRYVSFVVNGEDAGGFIRYNESASYTALIATHSGNGGNNWPESVRDAIGDSSDWQDLQDTYGARVVGLRWADTGVYYVNGHVEAGRWARNSVNGTTFGALVARPASVYEWMNDQLNPDDKPLGLVGSSGAADAVSGVLRSSFRDQVDYLAVVSYPSIFWDLLSTCNGPTPPGTFVDPATGDLGDSGAGVRVGSVAGLNNDVMNNTACTDQAMTEALAGTDTVHVLASILASGGTGYTGTLHMLVGTHPDLGDNDLERGFVWSAGNLFNDPFFANANRIWFESTTEGHGPMGLAGTGFTEVYNQLITTLVSGNRVPVANAGSDQNLTDADGSGSEVVTLSGLGSTDPDGAITSYLWTEATSTLGTSAGISPTLSVGTHTITLTVTDNNGAQDTDTVVVTVAAVQNITFDSASNATTGASSVSSLTWSHTTGSNTNRLLLVGVSVGDGNTSVSSIKYNGTNLTKVGDAKNANKVKVELWRLINPPSGIYNVVVTVSGSAKFVSGATTYSGVHQTSPLGTIAKANGTNVNPKATVSGTSTDLVIDVVAAKDSSRTLSVNASQTQRYQGVTTASTASINVRGGGSSKQGASSVTMSWSLSPSGSDWAIVAVAIKRVL